MEEIKDFISNMDTKTMVLIVIGYAIYIAGRNLNPSVNNRKRVYLIKIIPLLLALILFITPIINKVHHQSFERTLTIVLLVISLFSLFNKTNDEDTF
jgi:hypothetical protein